MEPALPHVEEQNPTSDITDSGVSEALRRAIEAAGDIYELAQRVGVSYQAVQKWVRSRRVPAERVLAVEKATRGRVRRSALRPDLYPPRKTARLRPNAPA